MERIFWRNGKPLYTLIPEKTAVFDGEAVNAAYVDMLLGTEKVMGELDGSLLFGDGGKPCLLGATGQEASRKAREMIRKDEWIVSELDDALVVTGWFDEASAAALRALAEQAAQPSLTLPLRGRMEGFRDIPDLRGGNYLDGIACGKDRMLLRYEAVTEERFVAYCEDLIAAGYRSLQENAVGGCRFVSFSRQKEALHLALLGTELRILSEPLQTMSAATSYEGEQIAPKLSMLNLYDRYSDGNDIGLCLIFTLCDGSFIVYDGGYTEDARQLFRALTDLNQRADGKIVVAAWFLTHDHGDHTGAFATLAELPEAQQITVENIIYSPNPAAYFWRSRFDPYHWGCPGDLDFGYDRMTALANCYGGDTRILHPHMGQKLFIRNAEVEVLAAGAQDLHPWMTDNFNDTSLVTRVHIGGQSVLVLGDCAADMSSQVLLKHFKGKLDCDILQVSHHGLGGLCREFYPAMRADVALWSTTYKTIRRNDLENRAHNAGLLGRVKQTLVADTWMHVLSLPFDADRDVPEKRMIGTYENMLEEMTMMIPRVKLAEATGKTFPLPLELTLSAGEFTDKAVKLLPLLLPQCSVSASQKGLIRASLNADLKPENYTLAAELGIVRIEYSDYAGLRNALAAFSQMVRLRDGGGLAVPVVKIEDAPVAAHRGVMLDIARGVKRFDQFCSEMILMAKARMNVLHIHLSDGQGLGICLDSAPEAMLLPGAYTKSQVRKLVELAEILGLELIPEFDMPAHSNSLLEALPELRCSVDPQVYTSPWTVCAGKEAVFQLFEKIIGEICELFPGRFFHMGGDELDFADAPKINQLCYWDLCPDCKKRMEEEGLADRSELYYYVVKRIHAMVTARGRRLVMWSEQMDADKDELLPQDILMQFWRIAGRGRGPAHSCSMRQQLERGYEVINSYYPETYIDVESYINEEKLRTWRWDTRPECDPGDAHRILGSELCCWEYGNEAGYPHYWASLPSGIVLMADKLWNGDELPDNREYSEALTRAVLGIGVPEDFNIWSCFGSRIPPRTSKFNIYADTVTATQIEREEVLTVLSDESRFAPNDFRRACAYKARLEDAPLDIPEPGVEPED